MASKNATVDIKKTELKPTQVSNLLSYFINNNLKLAKEGKLPVTLNIEGNAGIGKTSIIKQKAADYHMHFVRLNLAELTVDDLIGYPIKEFEFTKGKDSVWINENLINKYIDLGWDSTGGSRMSYAQPAWIHGKTDKPIILLLDDYSRASQLLMQATMTLIDEHRYISWSLPEGSTILLSTNPDNGEFLVTSLDAAQKSRFLSISMKFNVDDWAVFAEKYGIDGRCINFILKHPDVVEGTGTKDEDKKEKANIRLWTKYFDAISGIANFSSNLDLLASLGSAIPPYHLSLFMTFIQNKLDTLLSPKEMLTLDLETVKKKVKALVNDRNDIEGIMVKRLVNYVLINEKDLESKEVDQLWNLFTENESAKKEEDKAAVFKSESSFLVIRKLVNSKKLMPSKGPGIKLAAKVLKSAIS